MLARRQCIHKRALWIDFDSIVIRKTGLPPRDESLADFACEAAAHCEDAIVRPDQWHFRDGDSPSRRKYTVPIVRFLCADQAYRRRTTFPCLRMIVGHLIVARHPGSDPINGTCSRQQRRAWALKADGHWCEMPPDVRSDSRTRTPLFAA